MAGVFISYRREDLAGFAGRIYDRLVSRLETSQVFFDVDNIEPGLDFVKVLADRVGDCDALVAVIGAEWLASCDEEQNRRLDDPHDFVRIEIEAALQRDIRVIPVLINGARMPRPAELPDTLKGLARRQAIEISHTRFDSDSERLTRALQRALLAEQAPASLPETGELPPIAQNLEARADSSNVKEELDRQKRSGSDATPAAVIGADDQKPPLTAQPLRPSAEAGKAATDRQKDLVGTATQEKTGGLDERLGQGWLAKYAPISLIAFGAIDAILSLSMASSGLRIPLGVAALGIATTAIGIGGLRHWRHRALLGWIGCSVCVLGIIWDSFLLIFVLAHFQDLFRAMIYQQLFMYAVFAQALSLAAHGPGLIYFWRLRKKVMS